MGGTSTTTQQQQQQSTTNPWAQTIAPLTGIIGQVNAQIPNAGVNPAEASAFGTLNASAANGNPFAPAINNTTSSELAGGPDRSGTVTDAYTTLQNQLMPWANGSMADPSKNPALANMLSTITNDASNSVNSQFAAAGRDLSGANSMALGRGIAQGEAPTLLNAQQTGIGAANDLFGAGNTTTGTLSTLDQLKAQLQNLGIQNSPTAIAADNYAPTQTLALQEAEKSIPTTDLSALTGILGPIAGLGGSSSGSGSSTGTSTLSPAQQAWGWINSFANLNKSFASAGA